VRAVCCVRFLSAASTSAGATATEKAGSEAVALMLNWLTTRTRFVTCRTHGVIGHPSYAQSKVKRGRCTRTSVAAVTKG
jgi:hypothetical protein